MARLPISAIRADRLNPNPVRMLQYWCLAHWSRAVASQLAVLRRNSGEGSSGRGPVARYRPARFVYTSCGKSIRDRCETATAEAAGRRARSGGTTGRPGIASRAAPAVVPSPVAVLVSEGGRLSAMTNRGSRRYRRPGAFIARAVGPLRPIVILTTIHCPRGRTGSGSVPPPCGLVPWPRRVRAASYQ